MSETSYRELGDRETILPGDLGADGSGYRWPVFSGTPDDSEAYFTPAEMRAKALDEREYRWFRRIPAAPKPAPAVDPGEGWRLLGEDEVLRPSDECPNMPGEWVRTIFAGRRVARAAACPYRRRVAVSPLNPADIRRAAIIERHRDDCRPEMIFSADCVDGVRRYAASYDDACRVFDEAVRRVLESRPRHPDYRVAH